MKSKKILLLLLSISLFVGIIYFFKFGINIFKIKHIEVLGDRLKHEQDVAIHPFTNGRIVVNCPGSEGDIDGYNNKYITLSDYIVSQGLGAVVRCGNPYVGKWDISLRTSCSHFL